MFVGTMSGCVVAHRTGSFRGGAYLSCSPNSLKEGYIGNYLGEYYRGH